METVPAPTRPLKDERLHVRATNSEKSLVEQAAAALGMTTSQFLMQAAVRSAEEVLADRTRFVLAPAQWGSFVAALDRPAQDLPALREAAAKPSPFRDR